MRRVTSRFQNLYTHGLSASTTTSNTPSSEGRILASSANYSNDSSTSHIQAAKYQRQIIMNADGSYTDAPMGSYATANATAAAKIYLSE